MKGVNAVFFCSIECWQLQFNRVEEMVYKLNISFKDEFSPEIKFNLWEK